jgi:hypothetical protein
MDIDFHDPADTPRAPRQVRIRVASMQALMDGTRIRVSLELTKFQEKPVIEVKIINPDDSVNVSSTIVEATNPRMSLMMHVKPTVSPREMRGLFLVSYPELGEVDRKEIQIDPVTSE